MSAINENTTREKLFQEILNIIDRWPDLERNIFCEAHYYGRTPETIAASFHLDTSAVRKILTACDRRLHASLGDFFQKFVADPSLNIIISDNAQLAPPVLLHKKNSRGAIQQG